MYKKKSISRIKTILRSLYKGSSINSACQSAGVDTVTFWIWRKDNIKLDTLVKKIYDSRVAIVEDALYKSALEGSNTAQIFFLKNRAVDRWRDRTDPLIDNSKHEHKTLIIKVEQGNPEDLQVTQRTMESLQR